MNKRMALIVVFQTVLSVALVGVAVWRYTSAVPESVDEKSHEESHKEAAASPAVPARAPPAKELIKRLVEGNARFAAAKPRFREIARQRHELAAGQKPGTIVLGCSDSRVPPELVFDQGLGDLFVVRTAGNVADRLALGSMEYAVDHMHAKLIVVMGHERCGAVTAAAEGGQMPSANLAAIVDEVAPSLEPFRTRATGEELIHLGVEANVVATQNELVERSPLLREKVESGELAIVGALYDLDTGTVRFLEPRDAGQTSL